MFVRPFQYLNRCVRLGLSLVAAIALTPIARGGVLPEDRADVMYHSFSGGDVDVDGPSLLVRKKFGEKFSVAANYYVDMVTSASIDVKVLGASEYKEERTQYSASVDYLRGKTTYNLSFIDSSESDYTAQTASVGISEDMFGDLTTVSLGFTRAKDTVMKNVKINGVLRNDAAYGERPVDHRSYRVGISQIITKQLILGLNYESQTHEGQLSNPYRAIRYLSLAGLEQFAEELYPNTRTTNAVALDARYYLPYRAAIHGSYRFFTDTWGIRAQTAELGYVQPWKEWTFEGSYRYHRQEHADFFSDLFPRPNYQNFLARDRNLSTMNNQTAHIGVSYDLMHIESWTNSWLDKGSVNLFVDRIALNYEDFRDARVSRSDRTLVGREPLYSENALVLRFFVSVWF
jgi:hypothetical protein